MAKLVCEVCGAEGPVPMAGALQASHMVSGATCGEAVPTDNPAVLGCQFGHFDHELPMPKHCGKYMKYVK